MIRVVPAFVMLFAAMAPAVVHAEIFKCTEPDGRKVYQDRPCDGGQKSTPYDPTKANVTTIDSAAASREAQDALVTRAAGREAREPVEPDPLPYEPEYIPVPVYQAEPVYYPYPVYPDRDHHHHHHPDRPIPLRPDATPMSRPPRGGGGYVPDPPTIRDVAPRPPASTRSRSTSRERDDR